MKKFDSPIKEFPGHVEIELPLNYSQIIAIERAQKRAATVRLNIPDADSDATNAVYFSKMIPGVMSIVTEWHITGDHFPDNVTVKNFPAMPRAKAAEFLAWLWNTCWGVYIDEEIEEIPNG